jgi:hypothetical protein
MSDLNFLSKINSLIPKLFNIIAKIFEYFVLFSLIILFIKIITSNNNETYAYNNYYRPKQIERAPVDASTPRVTVKNLFAHYRTNYVAADRIYKNKWILITGYLEKIKPPIFSMSGPNLIFSGPSENKKLTIIIDKSAEGSVISIKPNSTITVYCKLISYIPDNFMLDKNNMIDDFHLTGCIVY